MNSISKTFTVLGIMSGSSLDGVDLAISRFDVHNGTIRDWDILASHTYSFDSDWEERLATARNLTAVELTRADREFGAWLGGLASKFLETTGIQVDLIASHGHTVFHQPPKLTLQIGHGAPIYARTGIPVVTDLRSLDIAFGGEGAPLAPLVDVHLFPNYAGWLNLGGIANATVRTADKEIAMDIIPCNQLLNALAGQKGMAFDPEGQLADSGEMIPRLIETLDNWPFLTKPFPRSLGNEEVKEVVWPLIQDIEGKVEDKLHTLVHWISKHIAQSLGMVIKQLGPESKPKVLCTGGGVWNKYLMSKILEANAISRVDIQWEVPKAEVVNFKESLLMALFGLFRYLNMTNTKPEWTGARQPSVGGVIYGN